MAANGVIACVNWRFDNDQNTGDLLIRMDVYYSGTSVPGLTTLSSLTLTVAPGATAAQVATQITNAIDAEADRRGAAVGGRPSAIYGPTVGKLR